MRSTFPPGKGAHRLEVPTVFRAAAGGGSVTSKMNPLDVPHPYIRGWQMLDVYMAGAMRRVSQGPSGLHRGGTGAVNYVVEGREAVGLHLEEVDVERGCASGQRHIQGRARRSHPSAESHM